MKMVHNLTRILLLAGLSAGVAALADSDRVISVQKEPVIKQKITANTKPTKIEKKTTQKKITQEKHKSTQQSAKSRKRSTKSKQFEVTKVKTSNNKADSKAGAKTGKQIWNLKDADIRAVIQTIAVLTGKNFIVDPRVRGKVTLISHTAMTPDEIYHVFLSMLQVLNFAAIKTGDVIRIVPSNKAKEYASPLATRSHPGKGDQVVVRVVQVNNVSASQLVSVIRPLMQQWGSVTAYAPANTLILAGAAGNIQRLVNIVHDMDRKGVERVSMIKLKHADAKKVLAVINSLQSAARAQGKVVQVAMAADEQNNSILMTGSLTSELRLRALISKLDVPGSSTSSRTEVFYLNYLDAKKMAALLTKVAQGIEKKEKGKNAAAGEGVVSIQAAEADNAIVIHAPKTMIHSLKKVVKSLDKRPDQVLVQAIIVKVSEQLIDQMGTQWTTQGQTQTDSNGNPIPSNGTTTQSGEIKLRVNSRGVGFISGASLQAVVSFLKNSGQADILSTPTIMVLNNTKAELSNGVNVGLFNRQNALSGNSTTNSTVGIYNNVQRTNLALTLSVMPRISPNNMLELQIDQKDQEPESGANLTSGNFAYSTSEIKTKVLVHSGDILVLGGLITNKQTDQDNKIPVLGDIPILGYLFRYNSHNTDKENLLIFIRPLIVHTNHDSNRVTRSSYNYIRHQQVLVKSGQHIITRDDLAVLPDLDDKKRKLHLPAPAKTWKHN